MTASLRLTPARLARVLAASFVGAAIVVCFSYTFDLPRASLTAAIAFAFSAGFTLWTTRPVALTAAGRAVLDAKETTP